MKVHTRDGVCRDCGGELEIIDADDATMTVHCLECEVEYPVETDAFGDGAVHYYSNFVADRMKEGP
jgi:hypothetical protein